MLGFPLLGRGGRERRTVFCGISWPMVVFIGGGLGRGGEPARRRCINRTSAAFSRAAASERVVLYYRFLLGLECELVAVFMGLGE